MEDSKRQRRPKHSGRTGPELRVVGIDCNPGPDAEDRLRHLFTMLVKQAVKHGRPPPQTHSSPDDDGQAEG